MKKGIKIFPLLSLIFLVALLFQCAKEEVPDNGQKPNEDPTDEVYEIEVQATGFFSDFPDSLTTKSYQFEWRNSELTNKSRRGPNNESLEDVTQKVLFGFKPCDAPPVEFYCSVRKVSGESLTLDDLEINLSGISQYWEISINNADYMMPEGLVPQFIVNGDLAELNMKLRPSCSMPPPLVDIFQEENSVQQDIAISISSANVDELVSFRQKIIPEVESPTVIVSMLKYSNRSQPAEEISLPLGNKFEVRAGELVTNNQILILDRIHLIGKDACSQGLGVLKFTYKLPKALAIGDEDSYELYVDVEGEHESVDVNLSQDEMSVEFSFNCSAPLDVDTTFEIYFGADLAFAQIPLNLVVDVQ
ncbi:hypothetical protein [Jiulongibacter sediminis]|uniref:Uncharacterized protein n=1 Tax=Jiulongibacter sediminis TaxID=1605367 RepID=A0A0P7BZC4_9BACT|nr:hypothetical protein [Jiulongibacter sediminis]KPM46978.1 hypothetical protein AFM12_17270 [Jiulongibacter sediminis]TBX22323.1 hypothetical protein TK44_17275 [Jiulongibacter sediminis]